MGVTSAGAVVAAGELLAGGAAAATEKTESCGSGKRHGRGAGRG